MNYEYDLIAPFYDIEHAHFDEDLDIYHNFAELCGGKILRTGLRQWPRYALSR